MPSKSDDRTPVDDTTAPGKTLADFGKLNLATLDSEVLGGIIQVAGDISDRAALVGKAGLQLAALKVMIAAALAIRRRAAPADDDEPPDDGEAAPLPDDPEALRAMVAAKGKK